MIGEWQPAQTSTATEVSPALLSELAGYAENPGAAQEQLLQQALPLLRIEEAQWQNALSALDDQQLLALAFFFVRAEAALSGFEAGARNPAIWVFRYLKAQGRKPEKDIVQALKAASDNRFIPYGNALL